MATVPFPRVLGTVFTPQLIKPGYSELRTIYDSKPAQLLSRGIAYWTGTFTFPGIEVFDEIRGHEADEIAAFVIAAEGGLQMFDIPLGTMQEHKPDRFPSLDESTDATSVHMTGRAPDGATATHMGYAATLNLDVAATTTDGLRAGDWFSLHSADMSEHYGAYQCGGNQAGNNVLVGPAPPTFPDGVGRYRLATRNPTLRARFAGAQNPAVVRRGTRQEELTIQWIQAA